MSLDLDQVLYARAGWRKAILIPLWTFQIAILLGLMGVFAYRLAETFEHYDEQNQAGQVPIVEVVWESTNVGFNLAALILNIIEIARMSSERLTPFVMVCTHVIKLTLAFAVLALDIVAYLNHIDGHYSTIGLALDCGLLAAAISTFIYTIITYRRLLQYEDYHLTANAKHQGYGHLGDGPAHELRWSQNPKNAPRVTTEFYQYSDSAYPSQTQPQPPQQQQQRPVSPPSPPPQLELHLPTSQPSSPSHHLPSPTGAALKREADRAMGSEFGWTALHETASRITPTPVPVPTIITNPAAAAAANTTRVDPVPGGSAGVGVARSGSVMVAAGTVPVRQTGMAVVVEGPDEVGGLPRARSWAPERGIVGDDGEEGVVSPVGGDDNRRGEGLLGR